MEANMAVMEGTPEATSATHGVGQLELRLAPVHAPKPVRTGSVRRPRRSAVARWWFARMRETVRAVEAWAGPVPDAQGGASQAMLVLTSPTTRFEPRGRVAMGLEWSPEPR